MKKIFTYSNISTFLLFAFILAMFISPDVKGWTIQGMMKIGLFQPDIPDTRPDTSVLVQDVIFSDIDGKLTRLSDLRGKVVFLNFWATWCPPCRAEMPSISELHRQFKNNKNIAFIMVDGDGDLKKSNEFLKKRNFTLTGYKMASDIPDVYFSGSLPTTVILDKQGRISFHHTGAADYANSKVSDFISKLIASDK